MIAYILLGISLVSLITLGYFYLKLKKLYLHIVEDADEQHKINHSHINTIFAIASLVDITWGERSKYVASAKEKKIITEIISNLHQ